MIITIDGTSASGKTTAARELAHRLGFALLRTGAMYRALALAAHRAGFDETVGAQQLEPHLTSWQIDADECHVYLNGMDVSDEIDGNLMSNLSSAWAELPVVRQHNTLQSGPRAHSADAGEQRGGCLLGVKTGAEPLDQQSAEAITLRTFET